MYRVRGPHNSIEVFFLLKAKHFLQVCDTAWVRSNIIHTLSELSLDRLDAIVDAAQTLFEKRGNAEKPFILTALVAIPKERLQDVMAVITNVTECAEPYTFCDLIYPLAQGQSDQLIHLAHHIKETPGFASTGNPIWAIQQFFKKHPHEPLVKAADQQPPSEDTGAAGPKEKED